MTITTRILRSLILSALLFGCSEPTPVPLDKVEYVGLWVAPDRYISIFGNGRFEYREKLKFGMHNRTESNFQFEGNVIQSNMFVSYFVNTPPRNENGRWFMRMDGVLYERVGAPVIYGRSSNWPEGVQ